MGGESVLHNAETARAITYTFTLFLSFIFFIQLCVHTIVQLLNRNISVNRVIKILVFNNLSGVLGTNFTHEHYYNMWMFWVVFLLMQRAFKELMQFIKNGSGLGHNKSQG